MPPTHQKIENYKEWPQDSSLTGISNGLAPNLMVASNLVSNGLQPDGKGLQPNRDGLQPDSNGLQAKSHGLQPNRDGLQPNSNGLQPNGDGPQPDSGGLQPKGDGFDKWIPTLQGWFPSTLPRSFRMHPLTDSYARRSWTFIGLLCRDISGPQFELNTYFFPSSFLCGVCLRCRIQSLTGVACYRLSSNIDSNSIAIQNS